MVHIVYYSCEMPLSLTATRLYSPVYIYVPTSFLYILILYKYLQTIHRTASWWLIKFTLKYIRKISSRLTQLRDILNCIIESISNLKPSNFILKHHTNKLCCHGGAACLASTPRDRCKCDWRSNIKFKLGGALRPP